MKDGSVRYSHREPCLVCGSRGSAGMIGRIVVDMREQDKESDRGDVY
jgi:hypothetical protein